MQSATMLVTTVSDFHFTTVLPRHPGELVRLNDGWAIVRTVSKLNGCPDYLVGADFVAYVDGSEARH